MKMRLSEAIARGVTALGLYSMTELDAKAYVTLSNVDATNLRVITPDEISAMREVLDDACQLQRSEKFYAPTRSSQIVEEWLSQQDAWGYGETESKLYSNFLGWCVLAAIVASCFAALVVFGGVK